jgi:hypothetical protein
LILIKVPDRRSWLDFPYSQGDPHMPFEAIVACAIALTAFFTFGTTLAVVTWRNR